MKTADSGCVKKINLLIGKGERFDFGERYDSYAVLERIGAASEALGDFPNQRREFLLYCITSGATPPERVGHTLWMLRRVRDRLQERAEQ